MGSQNNHGQVYVAVVHRQSLWTLRQCAAAVVMLMIAVLLSSCGGTNNVSTQPVVEPTTAPVVVTPVPTEEVIVETEVPEATLEMEPEETVVSEFTVTPEAIVGGLDSTATAVGAEEATEVPEMDTTATAVGTDATTTPVDGTAQATMRYVTVAEIASDPDAFMDQMVTVRDEVESVVNPSVFSMDEDALLEGGIDNDLLVINPLNNREVDDGELVQVTGTIRRFNVDEIELVIGEPLDPEIATDFVDRAVLVASSITGEEEDEANTIFPPLTLNPDLERNFGRIITVAEIVGNPDRFMNQSVAVRQEIEEVIAPGIFSLDEDALLAGGIDNDLLVISTIPGMTNTQGMDTTATAATMEDMETTATAGAMEDMDTTATPDMANTANMTSTLIVEGMEDQLVEVTGVVRTLVTAEIEREFGLDFDDELVVEFENRPVIIASSVRMVNAGVASDTTEAAAGGTNATLQDIKGNLAQYRDQTVTVEGEVRSVNDPANWTLTSPGETDPAQEIPVIGADESMEATINDQVRVTGTVREFNLQAIEQELGRDLSDSFFASYEGTPAIIATSIEPINE